MKRVVAYSLALIVVGAYPATCQAHVVIDNFASGTESFESGTYGNGPGRSRITGDVGRNGRGKSAPSSDFSYSRGKSSRNGGGSRATSTSVRYSSPLKMRSRSGSGGGGQGSVGRRVRGGNRNRNDYVQPVVIVKDPAKRGPKGPGDVSVDITKFKNGRRGGPGGRGPRSGAGGGAGGGGGRGDYDPEDDSPGRPGNGKKGGGGGHVSGTPEPTALVIWTLAGCCGLGAYRFRPRRSDA